ncbi:hypothetical protein ES332_D12G141200v1 [Gossypium tomentosum]|uniref:Uncharacterized protein n=1 Tax=Gossypium tomentosum TaxID=34277 RepID=A0A5D2IAE6_GOSTO|nr:hypothetical protein ES332_D12G141200v1 [Gossypium tomentosum]
MLLMQDKWQQEPNRVWLEWRFYRPYMHHKAQTYPQNTHPSLDLGNSRFEKNLQLIDGNIKYFSLKYVNHNTSYGI